MTQKHDWLVYSTAIAEKVLMVQCRNTGERGYVPSPTKEEWDAAYHAPSSPYPWKDNSRVVIDPSTAPPFTEDVKREAIERAFGVCES